MEGPNDDEFRVRSETTRVKGCGRLRFGRGFLNRKVIDEIDVAIGAPQKTDTILRFARGTEHNAAALSRADLRDTLQPIRDVARDGFFAIVENWFLQELRITVKSLENFPVAELAAGDVGFVLRSFYFFGIQ